MGPVGPVRGSGPRERSNRSCVWYRADRGLSNEGSRDEASKEVCRNNWCLPVTGNGNRRPRKLPIVGVTAINEFWWPSTTAKTTILKFVRTIDEVGGDASLAYVR